MAIKERLREKLERDIVYSLALRGFELTGCEKGEDLGSSEELILTILENSSKRLMNGRFVGAIPFLLITQHFNYNYFISQAQERGLINEVGYLTNRALQILNCKRNIVNNRERLKKLTETLESMADNKEHYLEKLFEWEKDFVRKRATKTNRKWNVYAHDNLNTYRRFFNLYYENGNQKTRFDRASS